MGETKQTKEQKPRAKRGGVIGRALSRVLALLIVAALVFAAFKWGPGLYKKWFGNDNIEWVSQRFSEELTEKNEMVVYEAAITGQETYSQNVWLFGTVQQVLIPYTFTINFVVDLSQAEVRVGENSIEVYLLEPHADYYKLVVDEEKMEKQDLFYPLTPEQYSEMKLEIEQRLYDECATKPEYIEAAWLSTESNIIGLFQAVADAAPGEDEVEIIVYRASQAELDRLKAESAQPAQAA